MPKPHNTGKNPDNSRKIKTPEEVGQYSTSRDLTKGVEGGGPSKKKKKKLLRERTKRKTPSYKKKRRVPTKGTEIRKNPSQKPMPYH